MTTPSDDWTTVGAIRLDCPVDGCGTTVPATVRCRVVNVGPGQQNLVCEPDMTDVWAHHFTHASPRAWD